MQPGAVLLLRADAGVRSGIGHVMRSLALAQAWQDAGGSVALASAELLPALSARLVEEGVAVHNLNVELGSAADATGTANLAAAIGARWIALDGYHFAAAYEELLAAAGPQLLRIDDSGRTGAYAADLLLDQNLGADPASYARRPDGTECLLGTDFALLRREFQSAATANRRMPASGDRRVLVTLGGTDPDGVTATVVAGLGELGWPDLEAAVVVGGGNPRRKELADMVSALPGRIQLHIDPPDLPALMAGCDVAVAAGGSTCWELCALGVPMLLLSVADNQAANVRDLAVAGAARDLGAASSLRPADVAMALRAVLSAVEERRTMSERGRELVDGRGARRVVLAMTAHEGLRLRRATDADAERLYAWVNDPLTRAMSFRSDPIPWADHMRWMGLILNSPDRLLLIAECSVAGAWQPIGQVRLDAGGVLSVGFDPAWRGRGLAAPTLRQTLVLPEAAGFGPPFVAYIRPENRASRRAFEQAGFRAAGMTRQYGVDCGQFVYPKAAAASGDEHGRDNPHR